MINYILQVILFQVLFLAVYDFFLSKETFFSKNRWYLISTPLLSFLIPLIKIPSFQKTVSQEFIVVLPEIVLSPEKTIQRTFQETTIVDSVNYVTILFWFGVAFFSLLFLFKLFRIVSFIKQHDSIKKANFTLILIPNQTKAFSFFNYIFLGKEIPESQKEKIIQHEMVHSQQKHTFDLLYFEFLKISMWFNPMIYLYQKRILLVHEYISDAVVAKSESKETYINSLLSNFFQVENISFINQFYKPSYLKKRIMMITKKQSHEMNQLKYLVLIPMLVSMLFYSSCSDTEKSEDLNKYRQSENEVAFSLADKAPIFPGCDPDDRDCFSKMINKHFITNFNSTKVNSLGLSSGKKRVFIGFKIDKNGNIGDVKIKAPHEEIKQEVLKVINSLPKMIPGQHEGKGATVKYAFPFTIIVGSELNEIKSDFIYEKEIEEVSFIELDKSPTFPGCEQNERNCFSEKIKEHFQKNFIVKNYPDLESGKKRIFIGFKIDIEGNVIDIQVKAPSEEIRNQVTEVINSLPKMTPGEHNGKVVAVKYSIPFVINIL
ncbi:M56 family metallopeptidase [Polaribacter sp.]|uniref:M56 family metallopeptidase n=1 Tax=Polaribacter sp. TaxID=1920175 RepID=UPI004047312C